MQGAETYFIRIPQYVYELPSPFGIPTWLNDNVQMIENLNFKHYKQEYSNNRTYLDFEIHKQYDATVLQIKGEGVNKEGNIVAINNLYVLKIKSPFKEYTNE